MHATVASHLARIELAEIIEWYDLQSTGLGGQFLDQYDQDFRGIAENPTRWPIFAGNVRRYVMTRFPHSIYYEIETNVIRVLGIIHGKRDPAMIARRIQTH